MAKPPGKHSSDGHHMQTVGPSRRLGRKQLLNRQKRRDSQNKKKTPQILELWLEGYTLQQIADRTRLSPFRVDAIIKANQ